MKKTIYMDNAATTKTAPEVVEAMLPILPKYYGNPFQCIWTGRNQQKAVNEAREKIADVIGAKANEIYFTAGGTEADNWAIDMIGTHGDIITSSIEHHAILNAAHNRFERDVKSA